MSRRGRNGTSWWRPVLVIVLPVLISTGAAVTVLIRILAPNSAQDRLDTVRTGLAIGAGIGALITLALALRRQQATEHDATERRLTELYVKAVDQLGSDKPAVRQGGLYALERVAQDNPGGSNGFDRVEKFAGGCRRLHRRVGTQSLLSNQWHVCFVIARRDLVSVGHAHLGTLGAGADLLSDLVVGEPVIGGASVYRRSRPADSRHAPATPAQQRQSEAPT